MQSKTSFFNRTLFRKNLSRYWPLWGFASFVGFLAPAALLVRVIQSGETSVEPLVVREIYYYLVADAVPIVSIAYAILCAMAVWSYLYNARSVGMMHSLPIRREGLFLTNLLSGLAMMAIPYLVAGGLGTLLFACCGGFDAWGLRDMPYLLSDSRSSCLPWQVTASFYTLPGFPHAPHELRYRDNIL